VKQIYNAAVSTLQYSYELCAEKTDGSVASQLTAMSQTSTWYAPHQVWYRCCSHW